MSLLRHLFGISSKISNSSKYPKTPKILIFRVFHIPPLNTPILTLILTPSEIPPKIPFSKKHHFFFENLKNFIFQKIRFFTFLEKPDISGFFIFCKKRYFLYFCYFCHFPHFRKNEENVGFLCFLVFSQNVHFYKLSFFLHYCEKGRISKYVGFNQN